jgi:YHS domain-containing protein
MKATHSTAQTPSTDQWSRRHLLAALAALLPLIARSGGPVNVNAQGVALQGHDPVAYSLVGKPVQGSAQFSASSNGATYWFADAANLQRFQADPARYEPQYGGFCAYGVAQGAKPDIDPKAFEIVDGKLYLNLSPDVQRRWQADISGHISRANKNWVALKDQ